MASTPSASALSAVLRCRGNLWTRNPQTKRPPSSAYSLGLAGGALRDSPAERNLANQASVWEAFLRGERVVVGGRLTVEYKLCQVDGWSALKSTCLSLTTLVSEFMLLRLAVLWRSSSSLTCGDAPQHLLCRQHEKIMEVDALQADRPIHSPTALTSSKDNSSCEQKLTEDRPD